MNRLDERTRTAATPATEQFPPQALIDGVTEPIMVIGTDYRLRMINRAAQTRYSVDGLVQAPFCYQISHHRDSPCDGGSHPCPLQDVLNSQSSVSVRHEHLTHDGEPRVVDLHASPLRGPNGEIVAVIESGWDVTERVRAEEALAESEQRFRSVALLAADAIVLACGQDEIIFWNKAAQAIFGHDQSQALGSPLSALVAAEHQADYRNAIDQAHLSPEDRVLSQGIETVGTRSDGSEFPMELSIYSWRSHELDYYCATARDLSDALDARRRTHQQDRLAAIGQLAAGIAHDFNNIMNVITIYSESMLSGSALRFKDQRRLHKILKQARRATALTQQFLDFGRKSILTAQPMDLRELLDETIDMLRRTLREHIQIQLDPQSRPIQVSVDPGRMQQVLINLALNAQDAMPRGGQLEFSLSPLEVKPGQRPPYRDMSAAEPGWDLRRSMASSRTTVATST